jgi:hypothetical protein
VNGGARQHGIIDIDQLDPDDPFEIDAQLAHLFKHFPLGVDDAYDVYFSGPVYFPARHGPAELLVGEVPGGEVLVVPLCASNSGDPTKVRPIGCYRAGTDLEQQFREVLSEGDESDG